MYAHHQERYKSSVDTESKGFRENYEHNLGKCEELQDRLEEWQVRIFFFNQSSMIMFRSMHVCTRVVICVKLWRFTLVDGIVCVGVGVGGEGCRLLCLFYLSACPSVCPPAVLSLPTHALIYVCVSVHRL